MDESTPNVPADASASGMNTVCVPLDALSVQGTPPAEGDSGEAQISYTVQSIKGSNAYIDIETVNDEDVTDDESGAGDQVDTAEGLMQKAQAIDQNQNA